jgi:RimJ/RimL family protein N-acetyltransferase
MEMEALATSPGWWTAATEILTDRLVLRAISPDDAAEVGRALWTNRDHLAPWINVPAVEPTQESMRERLGELADAFAAGERLLYTVRLPAGDDLLGCIGLSPAGEAWALSYWLAAAHTGQGYAREAVAALARLLFAYGGADRVVIECLRDNARSAGVARAVGFERTGERDGVQTWTLTPDRLHAWECALSAIAPIGAPRATEDGRALRVTARAGGALELRFAELDGELMTIALADVADPAALSPAACLAHNAALAVGALCLDTGRLRLRHACRPEALGPAELDLLLRAAGRLRGLPREPPRRALAFDHVL